MKYNTADVRFVKFVYLTFLCPLSPAVAYSVTLFHNDKRKYYSRVKFNCEVVHMRSTIMSWSLLLKSGHQHQRLHRYFICSLETCQIKILKPLSRLVVYFTSSFDATRVFFFFSVVTRWTGLADITISIILARDKWTKPLQSSNERKLTCLFFQLLMGEKDEYFFFFWKLLISCQTEKSFYRSEDCCASRHESNYARMLACRIHLLAFDKFTFSNLRHKA